MIVNSHPYNPPSQKAQQQRCIGINTNHMSGNSETDDNNQQQDSQNQSGTKSVARIAMQQNSLYGSNFDDLNEASSISVGRKSQNMFDLMSNLHHQQQPNMHHHHHQNSNNQHHHHHTQSSSLFDSAYGGDQQLSEELAGVTTTTASNNHHHHHQQQVSSQQQQQQQRQMGGSTTADVSLYSPSSSTSLLYHIYDQINVPNDSNNNNNNNGNGNNQRRQLPQPTASSLNPANLFNSNNQQASKVTTIQQHELYAPHIAPNLQQQFAAYTPSEQQHHNSMLFAAEYNQSRLHAPNTMGRHHQRPLSTSSQHHASQQAPDELLGLAQYGSRAGAQVAPFRTLGKSHSSNLAGLLHQHHHQQQQQQQQQHHHLNHLGHHLANTPPPLPPIHNAHSNTNNTILDQLEQFASNTIGRPNNKQQFYSNTTNTTTASSCSPVSFQQNKQLATLSAFNSLHMNPSSVLCSKRATQSSHFNNRWKRAQQRAQSFFRQHSTPLKCFLFILLAFTLITIIGFLVIQTPSTQANNQHQRQLASNVNPLLFPPPVKLTGNDQNGFSSAGNILLPVESSNANQQHSDDKEQDPLRSKLLIGEFVVLSQNYSHSPAHKSLLAENLVKLMDQVFLSTDQRRVYSRMEVTNIRPNRPSGVIVDCNIVLSESIGYAAQLFGVALYESLAKSGEKLANQPSFIIDKNSIRFNTVPDKDLRSGLIPPGLLAPSLTHELNGGAPASSSSLPDELAPTRENLSQSSIDSLIQPALAPASSQEMVQQSANTEQLPTGSSGTDSPVVWSAWSQWSSCVDKNGFCDPQRLHSRLRKCVDQRTGEKVEAAQCRQRFNLQDQELEVSECSSQCATTSPNSSGLALQQQQTGSLVTSDSSLMSDAPQGPQTAPSVMLGGAGSGGSQEQSTQVSGFLLPAALGVANGRPTSAASSTDKNRGLLIDQFDHLSTTERNQQQATINLVESSSPLPQIQSQPTMQTDQVQGQMSCSNCTSDEICLLLVQQKVPFCAKIKDRQDVSGCGGWCEQTSGQLCQPLGGGSNAYKCIHDSECLADEWRCHNSACIPLSKRCDGHSNCYDNSDERDCPAR